MTKPVRLMQLVEPAPMMNSLFPGHIPLTDMELFAAFTVEMSSGDDLWFVQPKWGAPTIIENPYASQSPDINRAGRIAYYRLRDDLGLSIFEEPEQQEREAA